MKEKKPRIKSRSKHAGPVGLGDILKSIKRQSKLGKQLMQAQIWERWPEIAGSRLSGHGHPVNVKGKTLHVEAYSAVWVNKFAYSKWDIIARINRIAGKEIISDLFVALAPEVDPDPSQHGG